MTTVDKQILLVDDDPGILRLLAMRLKASGYGVEAVESAEKALASFASSLPQLIITDLRMQGMDQALQANAVFWGIAERLSANAIHLAMSLLLLASPWLLLLAAPLHSAINLCFMRFLKRSLPAAQMVLLVLAALLLLASLWLAR